MISIEIKCKQCETPIKIDGIIITSTHIDFSQADPSTIECIACGGKWASVRIIKTNLYPLPSEESPVTQPLLFQ